MANVLITGGSRGIGEALVRAFCNNHDRVVFLYRTLSLANGNRVVETIERHYPLALSFDTNSILSLSLDDIPQMKVELNLTDKEYNYPKAQLKTEHSTKNLLIIALDS